MKYVLNIGFIGSAIFGGISICCIIQSILSTIFNIIFIKPVISLTKIFLGKNGRKDKHATLDLLKWHHNAVWKYLKIFFKVYEVIRGINSRFDLYSLLITWNPKIPLKGYIADKITLRMETLGDWDEEGNARIFDAEWITTYKCHGSFRILDNELNKQNNSNDEVMLLKCLWTSGIDAGRTFLIGKLAILNTGGTPKPNVIYFPPKIVVIIAEAVISAGTILAFFQLTRDSLMTLAPILIKSFQWISSVLKTALLSVISLF